MNDPIVDEVRRIREAHAAAFNYELDAIFRDLKEQEKRSGRRFVSLSGGQGNSAADASIAPKKARLTKPATNSDNIPSPQTGPGAEL